MLLRGHVVWVPIHIPMQALQLCENEVINHTAC